MAQVTITVPDDLLEQIDAQAGKQKMSRGDLLLRLAERETQRASEARRRRIAELLANPGRYGGQGARLIRADRDRDTR